MSTLTVNTISETTSGNGVSIDGLKVKDSAIVTATNKYSALKTGEANSLGYIEKVFVGTTYYLSNNKTISNGTYTHVDATWAKGPAGANGTTTGTTESDPFAQFSSGTFTPKVSGYWLCTFSYRIASVSDQQLFWGFLLKNWTSGGPSTGTGFFGMRAHASGTTAGGGSGAGIYALGTSDTVKLICYQSSGNSQVVSSDHTTIGFYYLGKSTI